MIVDDEAFFRSLLRDILEKEGFTVVAEAVNGEDAVAKYRQYRPAVTIMDIFMPEKHGIDATREIVEFDKNARVLICSASGFDDEVEAAFGAGARALILKPFMPDEITDTIDKVLHED
jgi:two-component system chemotaxis response regulator CheY